MKRYMTVTLSVFVMLLGMVSSAAALPMGSGIFIGGFIEDQIYVGDMAVADPEITDLTFPSHNDSAFNVNLILDAYNATFSPLPSPIFESYKIEKIGDFDIGDFELTNGGFDLHAGTEYVSLKWGNAQKKGGWALWYVGDLLPMDNSNVATFEFAGLAQGLSHYTEWESAPVPEPATMLLLGTGLLGLAGAGRKKLIKS